MSFLRTEISQTMKLASAASLNAGEANQVSFLGGSGDDTFAIRGNGNIIAGEQGDDNVMLAGDFNLVLDDCGDNAIYSVGNNNTTVVQNGNNIIYSEGNCNEIMADRGNQTIESHGHNNLIEAARDLGAKPLSIFKKVIVPETVSGVFNGSLMVFNSLYFL